MAPIDTADLRAVLAALDRSVPAGDGGLGTGPEIYQDFLDFLMVRAGLKPMMSLAQGHIGTEGVLSVAREIGIEVVAGPPLEICNRVRWPAWVERDMAEARATKRQWYFCRDRGTAAEVARVCETGAVSAGAMARLYHYPLCCVRGQHKRTMAYFKATIRTVRRESGGDEELAARLYADGAAPAPVTAMEVKALRSAWSIAPAPFVSFVLCDRCLDGGDGAPAFRKIREAADLAAEVDADFYHLLTRAYAEEVASLDLAAERTAAG